MRLDTLRVIGLLTLLAGGVAFAAQAIKGDPGKGKALAAEACASCHGADGNSEVPTFPKLAGQQESYLLRELQDYKSGKRANDIMTPLVAGLSDDDMLHLSAFYAKQEAKDGVVTNADLLAVGKKVYLEGNDKNGVPSCDGCHEENGEGSKRFPRVAGQHVDYTLDQIQQYATGKRSNGVKVMRTIAERLTPDEARAVAEYMASMK
jgi:cytochrome c553